MVGAGGLLQLVVELGEADGSVDVGSVVGSVVVGSADPVGVSLLGSVVVSTGDDCVLVVLLVLVVLVASVGPESPRPRDVSPDELSPPSREASLRPSAVGTSLGDCARRTVCVNGTASGMSLSLPGWTSPRYLAAHRRTRLT